MATPFVETAVTALRQRMLDDMAMPAMRSRTQHDYVRHVRAFAAFLRRAPNTATAEDPARRDNLYHPRSDTLRKSQDVQARRSSIALQVQKAASPLAMLGRPIPHCQPPVITLRLDFGKVSLRDWSLPWLSFTG